MTAGECWLGPIDTISPAGHCLSAATLICQEPIPLELPGEMRPEAGRAGLVYCGEEPQVNHCQSMPPVHLLSVKSTTPLNTSSEATVRKPSQTFANVVADDGPLEQSTCWSTCYVDATNISPWKTESWIKLQKQNSNNGAARVATRSKLIY